MLTIKYFNNLLGVKKHLSKMDINIDYKMTLLCGRSITIKMIMIMIMTVEDLDLDLGGTGSFLSPALLAFLPSAILFFL